MSSLVHTDETTGHTIRWNGGATFNVFNGAGEEVNVFTHYLNAEQSGVLPQVVAERAAREWWEEYGREATADVEREGLY